MPDGPGPPARLPALTWLTATARRPVHWKAAPSWGAWPARAMASAPFRRALFLASRRVTFLESRPWGAHSMGSLAASSVRGASESASDCQVPSLSAAALPRRPLSPAPPPALWRPQLASLFWASALQRRGAAAAAGGRGSGGGLVPEEGGDLLKRGGATAEASEAAGAALSSSSSDAVASVGDVSVAEGADVAAVVAAPTTKKERASRARPRPAADGEEGDGSLSPSLGVEGGSAAAKTKRPRAPAKPRASKKGAAAAAAEGEGAEASPLGPATPSGPPTGADAAPAPLSAAEADALATAADVEAVRRSVAWGLSHSSPDATPPGGPGGGGDGAACGPGPLFYAPQRWVVFTDLHVSSSTLDTCLQVKRGGRRTCVHRV